MKQANNLHSSVVSASVPKFRFLREFISMIDCDKNGKPTNPIHPMLIFVSVSIIAKESSCGQFVAPS